MTQPSDKTTPISSDDARLHEQLNAETGRLSWRELQRHFARGAVVRVTPTLDLVEVAERMVRDDKKSFERWLATGAVARATEDDAQGWHERDAEFWAVVTAPWVLVQEISGRTH